MIALKLGPQTEEERAAALKEEAANAVAAKERMRAALLSGKVLHTRFRPFSTCHGGGYVCAYRAEPTSPSGKVLEASCSAWDFDALFAELRAAGLLSSTLSPLSPTELL